MVFEVMNKILYGMRDELDDSQAEKLKTVLSIAFHDIQMSKVTTELALNYMDVNEHYLKMFEADMYVRNLSKGTIYQYLSATYKMLQSLSESCVEITKEDANFYLRKIRQRNYSNRTIDNIRRWIAPFFNWLAENDYIVKSPFATIKPPKTEEVKKIIPSELELESLRDFAVQRSKRDLAIFDFLYSTGVRVSELIALKTEDINFQEKTVLIYSIKSRRYRTIPLSVRAIKHIKEYHEELHSRGIYSEYVFLNERKTKKKTYYNHMYTNAAEKVIRELVELADIQKHITIHSFRKSLATRMQAGGINAPTIAYVLGHKSINTSMAHYIEMQPDVLRMELRKIIA